MADSRKATGGCSYSERINPLGLAPKPSFQNQTTAEALNRIRTPFGDEGSPEVEGRGPTSGIDQTLSGENISGLPLTGIGSEAVRAAKRKKEQAESGTDSAKRAAREYQRELQNARIKQRVLAAGARAAFRNIGAAISGAKSEMEAFSSVTSQVLSIGGGALLSAAITSGGALGLGAGASALLGGAALAGGTAVQELQHGGRVDSPMQIVGERGPELVSLPKGSRVHSNAETRAMMDTSALEKEVQALRNEVSALRQEQPSRFVLPIDETRRRMLDNDTRRAKQGKTLTIANPQAVNG